MENLHYHPTGAGRAPLAWPHQVGVVPPEAHCFQPRDARTAGDDPAPCRILCGLGGAGKTQWAARLAREAQRTGAVALLVWVTASTREAIESVYAQAGQEVAGADPTDPRRAAQQFLSWLQRTERRWLIVLDDVADPADLRELWPPHRPQGQVLVTTRRRDAALMGQGRAFVEVGVFTPDESRSYLGTKLAAHGHRITDAAAAELAADLGHLPLALAQAASYLTDQGLSCAEYRRRLRDRRRSLPDLLPEHGELPDDHRETVAAVWELSIERADQLRPRGLARPFLEMASVLGPHGIPAAVLTGEPARAYAGGCPVPEATGDGAGEVWYDDVPVEDAHAALRCLHRLSLITLDPDDARQTVRVHGLVQRATRESLAPERLATAAYHAGTCLLLAWPTAAHEQGGPLARMLRDNADALYDIAGEAMWPLHGYYAFNQSADSYGCAGMQSKAVAKLEDLCTSAVRHLGADHSYTLKVQRQLGYWRSCNKDADAGDALVDALESHRRVYGDDHVHTLAVKGHLAELLGRGGLPHGAVHVFEDILDTLLRSHPDERVRILEARCQIAFWNGLAHQDPAQIPALEHLHDALLAELDSDDELVLTSAHNIAALRGECGDPAGAAARLEEVARVEARTRGADHPESLTTRHNLAFYRAKAGDLDRAVAELSAVLDDRRRVLGENHPSTDNTRDKLAELRASAG
ncbi:tetratricopeptide repeat protein [Streptomyces sp. NPDC058000]|uniref:tetratricopeptide repeat protein n=1 Tax=Streptomyces sp. NPDC058000 TaxID=3346299 RepID=UPI0036E94C7C